MIAIHTKTINQRDVMYIDWNHENTSIMVVLSCGQKLYFYGTFDWRMKAMNKTNQYLGCNVI